MSKYTVTVIVPVYNVENYIEKALKSIMNQTFPFQKMEIIIIDDGSVDNSKNIAEEFASKHSNVKLFLSAHEGVSTARNIGIKHSTGKYIMFLDGDDLLRPDTVESVVSFFHMHYNEIDLVTYPLKSYKDSVEGEILPDHYRYQYLKQTGVYDLEEYPYITQTTMNIVIKNRFHYNILFRKEMSFTEDQAYCFDNLKRIFKIGYTSVGEYQYIRHTKSSSSLAMGSLYLFEQCMKFWEELFSEFETKEKIPRYVQAAYVNDLGWKNISNVLFPYHYRDQLKYKRSIGRIVALLKWVDDDIILNHPGLELFHRFYFLQLKNQGYMDMVEEKSEILICKAGILLRRVNNIQLTIEKIGFVHDQLVVRGYFASVLFNFIKKVKFVEQLYLNNGETREREIHTFIGAKSWNNSHTRTNVMWSFERTWDDVASLNNIRFCVKTQITTLPIEFVFLEDTPFYERMEEKKIIKGNLVVSCKENSINIRNIKKEEISDYLNKELEYYKTVQPDIAYIRESAFQSNGDRIWLYYDSGGVIEDNGFYQFIHDVEKSDGIQRYYVTREDMGHYVKRYKKIINRIIPFGKHQHQILFLNCEKIITAYIENYNLIPFSKLDFGRISDVLKYDVIYLQHGILHAYAPWKYMYLGNLADKIVISSTYEKKMLTKIYHYPEHTLIYAGMPRYAKGYEHRSIKVNEKYILYAPSWRAYLASMNEYGMWDANEEKFLSSQFWKELRNIIVSAEFRRFLERENLKFIIQLHPIFGIYRELLRQYENEWIYCAEKEEKYEECSLFITDYSSYVYDFVRKKTSILYFFPDEAEFYSGMNGYYRLTLPLEEGFGPIATTADELLSNIKDYANREYFPLEKYRKRMDRFFMSCEEPCEIIYQEIIS